jgi:hypothetical protein
MNTDVEELLRDGMERFTADVRAPGGLASEAGRLHRVHRRRVARTAVACGTAAVTAAAVALVVTGGARATGSGTALSPAQARTVAYVTRRVENALASENLVFVGQSDSKLNGTSFAWAYGSRNRFEEYWPSADFRGRVVNGQHLWDFPPQDRGRPYLAQGTALVGGKLVGAYVTYFDHRYSLWPVRSQPASACSTNAALSMAAPIIPTTHWSSYIDATLACGAATVTGHVKIDGVETTEITGKPVTVKLSAGYAKAVQAKFATARWTLYVSPATYLPVRMVGSTQTYGGSGGSYTSSGVTNVRWLPATPANVAQALVTIPPGFHRYFGLAGNQ